MNRSLIGAYLFALGAGSALAADLPTVKAPPVVYPLPALTWTGFYAGLNAGYDWGTSANATTVSTPLFDAIALTADGLDPAHVVSGGLLNGGTALANSGTARLNPSGFIGGGQVGYNYQWGSSLVAGLEADFQGADERRLCRNLPGQHRMERRTGGAPLRSIRQLRSRPHRRRGGPHHRQHRLAGHSSRSARLSLHAHHARLWDRRLGLWRRQRLGRPLGRL